MAVGKSSIQRVKVATGSVAEEPVKVVVEEKPAKKAEPKKTGAKKTTVTKKATEQKTEVKKTVAKKPATPKKDDIHEKKFEMIDGIYSELPTYLL
ncbi:MAG: hypothetical protein E7261_04805 [Lachnospiraceae bacterium]|nr:hypothetical protein [Lachnospiraceae bacterium]